MNTFIRQAFAQTGWALAAAGMLGVTGVARTQGIGSKNALADSSRAAGLPAMRRAETTLEQDRLTEMKVELAWLANPATAPYPIELRVTGNVLSMRGFVPDQQVRVQAVKTAREASGMRVVDELKTSKRVLSYAVTRPDEAVLHDVVETLRKSLPHLDRRVNVTGWKNGQVVVEGAVATIDDKLAVSRCLHRASGCKCVVNKLQILSRPEENSFAPPARAAVRSTPVIQVSASKQPQTLSSVTPPPVRPVMIKDAIPANDFVSKAAPQVGSDLPALQERVQRHIASACGKSLGDVNVTAASSNYLNVRVTAHSHQEADALATKIFALAELEPYQVALDVVMTP
jgi:osmotically-inducible protein OsmY